MEKVINIAIDGPAGAGKSTIARRLAKDLGFTYVDTGAMYRALAWYFIQQKISLTDEVAVEEALGDITVSIGHEGGEQHIFLNGTDVSREIRREEVGNAASATSGFGAVRRKLLSLQRDLARSQNCSLDGRDIGSFVLPDAQVKIYLTASVETRAKRRYDELKEKGQEADPEKIGEDIRTRDMQDMNRSIAPLIQAEDAVLLDSSDLTIEEVLNRIREIAREKGAL